MNKTQACVIVEYLRKKNISPNEIDEDIVDTPLPMQVVFGYRVGQG